MQRARQPERKQAREPAALRALSRSARAARRVLSANLKKERARTGLTQERAAEAAEFSLQYFQRIERGIVNVPLDTIARLAVVFGVEPFKLLSP